MGEYDESSEESSFFDLSNSLSSGAGDIFDGAVEVTKSAGAVVRDSAEMFGDVAEGLYHNFAAAEAALNGRMATANVENATAEQEYREANQDAIDIREDLGF